MKVGKTISIICSAIGFLAAGFALVLGLGSLNASGWDRLGVIFIAPSVIALIIIILDFLISIDKTKLGSIYSWISTLLKIGLIILLIPSTIYDYNYEMEFGVSNLSFDLTLIALLIIVAIPSIFNIVKIKKSKKQEN